MYFTLRIFVLGLLVLLAPASYADQSSTDPAGKGVEQPGNTVLAQFGGRFRILVVSATYGGNCGARPGNVTEALADACTGRRVCEYTIRHQILGDPVPGCPKDFVVRWQCGDGRPRRAGVPPEAGFGSVVFLSCRERDF